MIDRIVDPWGTRTPYPQGGDWPVRVDENVEGPVEEWVQSACVLCSHGCALDIGVRDGRIVGVRGRGDDRVNHGRLGPKGLYGWQANNSADRLLHPLVRRDGELREASWDEAMSLVAERSASCSRRRAAARSASTRADSSSSRTTTRWRSSPGGDRHEPPRRQHAPLHGDGGAVVEGDVRLRWPARRSPRHRVLRHDPARRDQHGRDADGSLDARARSAARPRPAALDRDRPAPDGVGAGGGSPPCDQAGNEPRGPERARSAADRERPRRPRVRRRRTRSASTRSRGPCRAYTPERVAEICGVAADDIRRAAEILGEAEHLLTFVLQGVYQSHQATASACAANNINLLRGMIGRPGVGHPADERPADRAEHARDRLQR